MKTIKAILILAVILMAYSTTTNAQLQVSSTGFMMQPGDEEPPIGVYPNKTEGEKDSVQNDTKDKTKGKKPKGKKPKGKDANGNPVGTLYTPGDRFAFAACVIGEENNDKENGGNPLDDADVGKAGYDVYNKVSEVYDEVVDYFFPSNDNTSSTTNKSTASQCTHFEILLTDKPVNYKNSFGKGINKLSKSKQWHQIKGGYFYLSKNKIKKYAYVYFVKNKPSKNIEQPAVRYKVRMKKKKIILFPFN